MFEAVIFDLFYPIVTIIEKFLSKSFISVTGSGPNEREIIFPYYSANVRSFSGLRRSP